MVGDAFKAKNIRVHFDLGPNYVAQQAAEYVVPPLYARGGELIAETACVPEPGFNCQFPDYAGVVSWKLGYQLLRDAPVGPNGEELTAAQQEAQEDACRTGVPAGANCRRRFDRVRLGIFRYGLYVHYRGMPIETCLTDRFGVPLSSDPVDLPAMCRAGLPTPGVDNPADFHVPSTSSGKGDLFGVLTTW